MFSLACLFFPTSVLFSVQLKKSTKINPTIFSKAWDRGRSSVIRYDTVSGVFLSLWDWLFLEHPHAGKGGGKQYEKSV